MSTHKGPRGGRYRVVNGRKRYDVPSDSDRRRAQQALQGSSTGAALLAEADDAPGSDLDAAFYFCFFIVAPWIFAVLTGWGPLHGVLFPFWVLAGTVDVAFQVVAFFLGWS